MAISGSFCRCKRRVRRTLCLILLFFVTTYTVFFMFVLFAMAKLKGTHEMSIHIKNYLSGEMVDFTNFDNISGSTVPIIPNVVHYVKFRSLELNFIEMLSIRSVQVNHRPERIVIHCGLCNSNTKNSTLAGKYWEMVQQFDPKVEVVQLKEPTHIFGKRLSSVYHASDIARILVLMDQGGIFLDSDMFVVRSLNRFLRYEFSIGWPSNENIGTQVLIGHKNSRFLKLWLNSYRWYRPFMWYYNAGQLPTESILSQRPGLVHREPVNFGVHYLIDELYKTGSWDKWKEFYTVHLLSRHRSYLDKDSSVDAFDEENIKKYNFTFGAMARSILYGTTELVQR